MLLPLLLAAATPSAGAPIATKEPAQFMAQLSEMGYSIDNVVSKGNLVQAALHLPDRTLAIVLGGCVNNHDCTYVTLVGVYSDIKNPPATWVEQENSNYDLIKLWIRNDGALAYSAGVVIDGLPRQSFKNWIDIFVRSANAMGGDAVKAGYNK